MDKSKTDYSHLWRGSKQDLIETRQQNSNQPLAVFMKVGRDVIVIGNASRSDLAEILRRETNQ